MIKTKVYNNGLKLVVEEMPNFDSCAFYVMVKTGSINETPGFYGISHFIEHMLFKGTKKRNSFEITNAFAQIGASVNAYTSNAETAYFTKSVGENVESCAEIISDMLFNSVFDEKEMSAEKKVVCEEIAMYSDDPNAVCEINVNKIFYNGTEYSRDVAATQEDVNSLTYEKIKNYMNKNYAPKNIIISFAGNITMEKAEEIVEKYYVNNFKSVDNFNETVVKMPRQNEHQIVAYKDNQQSVLCISYPALLGKDENEYALKVMNYILGVGMSSRLFQTIREKLGLVYGIHSSTNLNSAYGDITISLSTTNKNVPLALSKIKEEIIFLAKNGVNKEEFDIAKVRFISNIKMAYENTSNVSVSNAKDYLFYNEVLTKDQIIDKINKVTIEDVNKIAKEVFLSDRFALSYVGPQKDINLLDCYNK